MSANHATAQGTENAQDMPTAASQPQWPRPSLVSIRDFNYTHTQPQWSNALGQARDSDTQRTSSSPAGSPASGITATRLPFFRKEALAARRLCTTCHFAKEACTCSRCAVCRDPVYRRHRHHCRSCWNAVCPNCYGKERYVHPLGARQLVCDRCAVPWALANLAKREDSGLFWGLYLLRRAGEMPCLCVAPICRTLTYRSTCYVCGTPTVMTQPHVERVLRVEPHLIAALDRVRMLDAQERSLRSIAVDRTSVDDVEKIFRTCFQHYEELMAFEGIRSTREGQWLLLSLVAASVSYEYHSAPDLTLALSDVPYARVLKVVMSRPRYSILESPGRIKFLAFPGTHNWRTRMVDLRFSQEVKQSWTPLIEGVRIDPATGQSVMLCGGLRRVWSYRVHGGFAQETREADIPIRQLADDVRQGYRLILSGHSLGGAVAQLVTVQLLSHYPELFAPASQLAPGQSPAIMCVTMGAPLVGNYEFVDRVSRSGWAPYFHNFVYHTDIVPRLSCGDELTWDAAARIMEQASSVYRNVQNWFTWRNAEEAATAAATEASTSARADITSETDSARASTVPNERGRIAEETAVAGGPGLVGVAAKAVSTAASVVNSHLPYKHHRHAEDADAPTLGTVVDVLRSAAPQLAAEATGTSLESYVDASIRAGRVVLAEEEDVPRTAWEAQAHVASTLRQAQQPLTPHAKKSSALNPVSADRDVKNNHTETRTSVSDSTDEAAILAAKRAEEEAIALVTSREVSRRMHRRYACLGRFHLLGYGEAGYISTADSEVAFGLLKNGCGDETRLIDHSVSSYNRGIMLHLYGKKE